MTSAAVLVGLALLVGGFAWMATGSRDDTGNPEVLTHAGQEGSVGFVAMSPRDLRIKSNIEKAKRELVRIRKTGKEVSPNTFMIEDENGEPVYYRGDLIEGRGRFGEKIYATSQLMQIPTLPLKKPRTVTGKKLGKKGNFLQAAAPVDSSVGVAGVGSPGAGDPASDETEDKGDTSGIQAVPPK